jgi:membrane protein YqaA with SNARE-associated domain
MRKLHIDIRRLMVVVSLLTLTTIVASLTVGRDIYEHNTEGFLSFAIVNFAGYLFIFLFMPVELAFIYYLRTGYDPVLLNLVAIGTAFPAQVIDYLIGYYTSAPIIERLIGKHRYEKAENEIRRYGNLTLFFSNLLPLSSPVISLAAGMMKHRVKDALLYSFAGMVLRYLLLSLIF